MSYNYELIKAYKQNAKHSLHIFTSVISVIGIILNILEKMPLCNSINIILLLIIIVLLDFIKFLTKKGNDHLYKFVSEYEYTNFSIPESEIKRDIDSKNFMPRALSAKSEHKYEVEPLGSNIGFIFHEFRRSNNNALKWYNFNKENLISSFKCHRMKEALNEITVIEESEKILKIGIDFDPPLEINEGSVSYEFTREYAGAQFLSMEDLTMAINLKLIPHWRQFCIQGRKIVTPTDRLIIKIEFPSWYVVRKFKPRVTRSCVSCPELEKKLHVKVIRNSRSICALMEVSKDIIYVENVYSITWLPPCIDEVRKAWNRE